MPKQAVTDEEIENCFSVLFQLRPHLAKDFFLTQVREMESDGFRLGYIEYNGEIVAVAGYRVSTTLFMGRHLYVDDLVTSEKYRSKGYGEKLIKWLREMAIEAGCRYLHLDSGTQRHSAHKFYIRNNFNITSYHFAEKLNDG